MQQLYVAKAPEILSNLRQVAVVESTESSSCLEGVVGVAHRLNSPVLRNTAPQSRSEQEVAGYRDALSLIHESRDHMPFSEGTVLQLHGILYRYMPQPGGNWKATNNDTIERYSDGNLRIRLQPVAASNAHGEDRHACALPHGAGATFGWPLVVVLLVVFDLLCNYLFPDGKGRMERLLTPQLYYFDYTLGHFICLERISRNRKKATTRRWRPARSPGTAQPTTSPWLDYFWARGAVSRAYKQFELRVGAIGRGRGGRADRVRMEIHKRQLSFSSSKIEEAALGVNRDMARVILGAMKAEGLIELNGKGRGAKWQRNRP